MANPRQILLALGLGAAAAAPALLVTFSALPAAAQLSVSIGYETFHSRLAPYGTWSLHPRWGEVWHPTRVSRDFRPYYDGHWVNTREYGWLWVSNENWGDIPYHYGRWVFDRSDGWLWVPGYVWAPSWVVWRSGGGNIGWFPMPPGDDYYGDGRYRGSFDNDYGYRNWYGPGFGNDQFMSLWIFVSLDHFGDRDYRNYAVPQRDYARFISQTTDTTNYVTVNNYVVNRSIDVSQLPRGIAQRLQPVPANNVISRDALVTQANLGRQVEQRERQQRPIPVNINPVEQRGGGKVNSNAQQQTLKDTRQGFGNRTGGRGPGSNAVGEPNPQGGRAALRGSTTPVNPPAGPARPNPVAAPQRRPEPRNQGSNLGEANPKRNQGANSPQLRGQPAQTGQVARQQSPAAARVQENVPAAAVPAANSRANTNNEARGNRPNGKNVAEQNSSNEKKAAEERPNSGGGKQH